MCIKRKKVQVCPYVFVFIAIERRLCVLLLAEPYVVLRGRNLKNGGCIPSLKQITQWSAALIDTHLVGLASRAESRQVDSMLLYWHT